MSPEWKCNHCDFSVLSATQQNLIRRVQGHQRDQGGNVLVHEGAGDSQSHHTCIRQLSVYDPAKTGVLIVTKSPARKLEGWKREHGDWPQRLEILTPNIKDKLPSEEIVTEADFINGPLDISEIEPTELNRVARDIDEKLRSLDNSAKHVTVCFDNMTELVNSFGPQPVFKFTHAINGRIRSLGAVGHWHYKPETQIESSNHIIHQLFQLLHETRSNQDHFEIL